MGTDANRTPLRLEVELKVGDVRVDLASIHRPGVPKAKVTAKQTLPSLPSRGKPRSILAMIRRPTIYYLFLGALTLSVCSSSLPAAENPSALSSRTGRTPSRGILGRGLSLERSARQNTDFVAPSGRRTSIYPGRPTGKGTGICFRVQTSFPKGLDGRQYTFDNQWPVNLPWRRTDRPRELPATDPSQFKIYLLGII